MTITPCHNTVEMATRRKQMILSRVEDLEFEWARLEAGGTHSSEGVTFPLRGRLVTDGGPDGWGATLWLPGVKEPLLGSGKWRPEDIASGKTRQQAWREGWSVNLAVLAFLPQMVYLRRPPFCVLRIDNLQVDSPMDKRPLVCRGLST